MVLAGFLKKYKVQVEEILRKTDFTESEVDQWLVIQYPDELLYTLSKHVRIDISELLYELLDLENAGIVRKVLSDYGLKRALESEVIYIYIPKNYRKEKTRFLSEILIEKNIYTFDKVPSAKYNLTGQQIYTDFLSRTERGKEFKEIEQKLLQYFVFVHDDSGSLLCHSAFKQTLK